MNDVSAVWHIITHTDWMDEKTLFFSLLALYLLLVAITFLTWKKLNLQAAYFGILCIAIYAAEHINTWCAKNWKLISSKQQYFDSSGLFISVVYSIPILFNLVLLVIMWLKYASHDLIHVKQQELLRKMRDKKKKDN